MKYCESIYHMKRWKTREVMVGKIGVGGQNPVRIQSMTTSNTRDIDATVDQIIRLADSGCEIARVTVQGIKEAEACEGIKGKLLQKGYEIPLVADIHFYPPAAMKVVEFADKVRINPGNFVDKRASFKTITYDDASYKEEIDKIEEKFSPLVEKCKVLKRAMRIGTNHGSLSDRIMNRYGDTPAGMVESALEFARVCRALDYHDFMFSMKASNPLVMMQAYRLLVAEMIKLGWNYPLHLGVTESGAGEDGREKSSVGIGSLLLDGLGDTIRVSLTEDPWSEIDPCARLIKFAKSYEGKGIAPFVEEKRFITEIEKRSLSYNQDLPLHRDGSVLIKVQAKDLLEKDFFTTIGCQSSGLLRKKSPQTVDAIIVDNWIDDPRLESILRELHRLQIGILSTKEGEGIFPIKSLEKLTTEDSPVVVEINTGEEKQWEKLLKAKPKWLLISFPAPRLHITRKFFTFLKKHNLALPVILSFSYGSSFEDLIIEASAECGALLADGLGEGVCLSGDYPACDLVPLSFSLLQAVRMRSSKTDFISCPGCGRTLFELQQVTAKIQKKTGHLPGVKIAIMGCIVNGPGEMADADFGYVGSKPGKIDLYVGKTCVERDIEFSQAEDRLVNLIKSHGRWVEPEHETEYVEV